MITIKTYARKEQYGAPLAFLKSAKPEKKSPLLIRTIACYANPVAKSSWPVETKLIRELNLSTGKTALSWPIKIEMFLSGGFFVVKNEDLGVYSYGSTQKEAQQNFTENFEDLLELYNASDYAELTGDAIRLKALFDKIVNK